MSNCILPWISLETTPLGGARPCCLYTKELPNIDLTKQTLDDAFNSKEMQDLRRSFRNDEKPDGCERCWMEEKAGKKSKREYMLEKFKDVKVDYDSDTSDTLQFLDLKLGNICNLKCRICGSWSSSKWAQEEIAQYGKENIATEWLSKGSWPRRSKKFWEHIDTILPTIKYFEFTGGEPFLIKQHFDLLQRAVDKGYSNEIDIHYNTNGTQFPKQYEVWKTFKHVQIAFSIDNVGERFEYERDGASWSNVNENIKKFRKLKEQGYPFSFQICVTWNIQNIYYMKELLQWAETSGISDIHFNLMHDPEEFSLSKIPYSSKSRVMLELQKTQVMFPKYADKIIPIKKIVTDMQGGSDGEALRLKLRNTDLWRGISFANTHPEMARLIRYE
jgi:sulfatase maturation enzyme AslB (radical SAM superfamily)